MHPQSETLHAMTAGPSARQKTKPRDVTEVTEGLVHRLLSRMKFRDINLLINIYELRSIRAASLRCNISQAAGTKRLQEVEDALGMMLFVRQPTLLKPTPEGEVVYQACLQWKAATQSLAARLQQTQQGLSRRLTVGVGHSYLTTETVQMIQEVAEHLPMMDINIRMGSGPSLVQGLLDGSLDLVMGIAHGARDEALINHDLPAVEVVPVASPGHPLLREQEALGRCNGACLTPERLSAHRWLVMPEGDPLRNAMRQLFPEGMAKGLLELNSLPAVLAWMQIQPCLALLPKTCVESMAQRGVVAPLPCSLSVEVKGYRLVHHRNKNLCDAATMLLERLVPHAARGRQGMVQD